MPDVGIRMTMTENVSSVAPQVSSALREISRVGGDMQEALDLGDLEQKYKQFADRVDRIYDVQKTNREAASQDTRAAGQQQSANLQQMARMPANVGNMAGRSFSRLGSTGDVADVAPDVLGSLGIAGGTAGAVIAVIGALAFGGNALSNVPSPRSVNPMPDSFHAIRMSAGCRSSSSSPSGSRRYFGSNPMPSVDQSCSRKPSGAEKRNRNRGAISASGVERVGGMVIFV